MLRQAESRLERDTFEGFAISRDALGTSRKTRVNAERNDATVAVIQQVSRCFSCAAAIRDRHSVEERISNGLPEGNHRQAGKGDVHEMGVPAVDRGDQQSVDPAADKVFNFGTLYLRVTSRTRQDNYVSPGMGGLEDRLDCMGCTRVGWVGNDYSNGGGFSRFEPSR